MKLPESWTLPNGRTVTPQTETLEDFLVYSAELARQEMNKAPLLSHLHSSWAATYMAYTMALTRLRRHGTGAPSGV